MQVRVRLPTQLRNLAAGASSVVVIVESTPVTVSAVLDSLAATHPALERRVRDEAGRTRIHVNLFVDADNIRDLDGVDTTVADGSDVSVIPAISGG
ncbi:MAG: sulfur-carrier protein [Ilumatobacteraceae bacterium]|jgi:molybdopterin converting factor small subunit|nr:sulfur-carrier protein [Ilumatobacteraceae bacterium]